MKKNELITKYGELKNMSGFLARACGVSPVYVLLVLKGKRIPKTNRAKKAVSILKKAGVLLELLEPESGNKSTRI